jgi:Tol biopolymer transport system component
MYAPLEHRHLRDRVAGTTTMIGDTNAGATDLQSSISGDGRYVAYTNLDLNYSDSWQVFVYDTTTGDDELVGVLPDGTVGDDDNLLDWSTALSNDGNYIAFESDSTNLVTDDLNGAADVFEQRLN